jgi:hypothetical protein
MYMIKADQPTIFDKQRLLSAVSSRQDGTMKILNGDTETAFQNRRRFLEELGLKIEDGVLLYVGDHTTWDAIHDVTAKDRGAGMQDPHTAITGDALVTNLKGLALFLYTADCNADIIYDPVKDVVALAHLGWQSTAADLAGKVIRHLVRHYGSRPEDLYIYNGPSIRAQSYIMDLPVAQTGVPGWAPYLMRFPDGRVGIDLVGYNREQFIAAGVLDEHIQICPVDTGISGNYFSHYRANREGRAQDEGRFVSVCSLLG